MTGKSKPKEVVNVYNHSFTIASGNGKIGSQWWFTFRSDAIYSVEATITNLSGYWHVYFLGGSNPTIISGELHNWYGGKIESTFKFTSNAPNRLNVRVETSTGHTATVKLTETIPGT